MNYDPYKKEDVVKAIKREGGSSFLESQVKNPFGIHARPSAAIVKETTKYSDRQIFLTNLENGVRANAKSIIEIMTIEAYNTARIMIEVSGEDEGATKILLRIHSSLMCSSPDEINFNRFE